MGQSSWKNGDLVRRQRAPFIQRTSEEQRWWENIATLQRGTCNCIFLITHQRLRQPTQHLRSHYGLVTRTCSVSRSSLSTQHGDNCCWSWWWYSIRYNGGCIDPNQKGHSGVLEPEETGCDNTKRNSKIFHVIFKLTKAWNDAGFVKNVSRITLYYHSRSSSEKEMAQQAHVENFRIFEVTIGPNRKDLFGATPQLVWYWKWWSQNLLTVKDLKSRSILCRKTGLNPGWLWAGVLTNTSGAFRGSQRQNMMTKRPEARRNLLRVKQKTDQLSPSSSSSSALSIEQRN